MEIVCLDLEGVLVPEIWIAFAEETGIPELKRTTRDEPDYDKLMKYRIGILKEHGLGLKEIQETIAKIDPIPGAKEFLDKLRAMTQVIIISDTFSQFAGPLMKKLGYPTIFCNSLEVADNGEITGFKMRCEKSKYTTVKALQSIGYDTIASGDSHITDEKGEKMTDEYYMRRAIALAQKGEGQVSPNPLVGAVIVKDGKIIGEGYHEHYGQPHAERNALANCIQSPEGATIYVTLEPCCHHGKQPPCTDALLAAGIRRVVIGSKDPNPLVHGKGIRILREHGVEVTEQVLQDECDEMNEVFFHYIQTKLPFVILKYAMTLDGKIATYTGASRWVTGEAARAHVHRMRNRYHAIMGGVGTVLADDPMLTCRLGKTENGVNPVRIICDTVLRTPLESQIVRTAKEVPTIIASCNRQEAMHMPYVEAGCQILVTPEKDGQVDLWDLMRPLGQLGIDSVILEGGGTLNWSALQAGIVQKVQAYVAPKLFGGTEAKTPVEGQGFQTPADAVELTRTKITALGLDWLIEGYPVENRRNMGCLQES